MICTISLAGPLKKLDKRNVMQVSPANVIANVALDPSVSGFDVLVLQPKDLTVFGAKNLIEAINERHEDIKVIYIYSKESDAGKLNDVDKYLIKKLTPENLKEAVETSLAGKAVSAKDIVVASNDRRVMDSTTTSTGKTRVVQKLKENVNFVDDDEEDDMVIIDDSYESQISETEKKMLTDDENSKSSKSSSESKVEGNDIEEPISIDPIKEEESVKKFMKDNNIIPNTSEQDRIKLVEDSSEIDYVPKTNINNNVLSIEERINRSVEFTDWNALKEACNLERIKIELMNESSQYSGCLNYMSVIEQQITTTFNNNSLSAEDKMLKIRELGINKSGIKAQSNNLLIEKYTSIMDAVTNLVCKQMDKEVSSIKNSLNKLVVKQDFFTRENDARDLIDRRLEIRVNIAELMRGIISTYQVMHSVSQDIIGQMDENLPTENKYINEIMKSYESYFKPSNAASLFMDLTRAVEEKRLMLSSVEQKLESLFNAIFRLVELDDEIIANYQNKFDLFKAQNTEEVVVMTTMLKSALRVYIGPQGAGLTTTVLTLSGCQARRRNTILLDLRQNDKISTYNVNLIDLNTFLDTNVEQDLVVCHEQVTDVDRLEEIITKLNNKLYYYFNINILIDEHQVDFIERLNKDLRTLVYVTNCTPISIEKCKEIVSKVKVENVAQKIIEIAPPIEPVKIALDMGIDVTKCQVLSVPYSIEVAQCTAKGEIPYYKKEIRDLYEKGIRI